MTKRGWWASLALCALPAAAWSEVRLGSEFQVNSYTTFTQRRPAVAFTSNGGFVVVWSSLNQDGSDDGVFGQRFGASGMPQGAEFQVNSFTTGNQRDISIGSSPTGKFVVVWASSGQDGSYYGVFGQRFDAAGTPEGAEFQVNTFTTGAQRAFSSGVTWLTNDSFVVVWTSSHYQDGSGYGIFGQRFSGSGARQGVEFRVNSYTTGNQRRLAVASDANANFVVVWDSGAQYVTSYGVFGQRYDASGAPLGAEFQVDSFTTGDQFQPAVAYTATGDFVIAWSSRYQDGDAFGVFGRRYDASGASQGTEFQVNSYTTSHQYAPSVAAFANDRFVVVWTSFVQDGSQPGAFGQHFDASGAALGGEFQVNTYTTGYQYLAQLATAPSGHFVVGWNSFDQDGSGIGVFAQRFALDVIFQDGFEN